MNEPSLIKGGYAQDTRGKVIYVNDFDMKDVRRFYQISNSEINYERGWQGHKIEQRWFHAIKGIFKIKLIAFEEHKRSDYIDCKVFILSEKEPAILHIPPGYVSNIKAETEENLLGVYSDFTLGSIDDEIRYDLGYFNKTIEINND